MRIERFEDLEIWKEARELSVFVYKLTSKGPFQSDFRFRDQFRASAGSIMDNIAEGFDRGGNKEFVQFLSISKGSLGEVRYQAYRSFDIQHITKEEFDNLLERTDKISRKISALMNHLKSSTIKGPKYL